ncbi:MAG: divalent-cation tolerance protein CutA [Pseudomonadota bacterium]
MEQTLLVLTNMPDTAAARMMARHLVEERLAACVNFMPAVQSVYRWQDQIEEATEVTLLIKTTQARYAELEAAIKRAHPYQTPEIIAMAIVDGLSEYLGWIAQETKKELNV